MEKFIKKTFKKYRSNKFKIIYKKTYLFKYLHKVN